MISDRIAPPADRPCCACSAQECTDLVNGDRWACRHCVRLLPEAWTRQHVPAPRVAGAVVQPVARRSTTPAPGTTAAGTSEPR